MTLSISVGILGLRKLNRVLRFVFVCSVLCAGLTSSASASTGLCKRVGSVQVVKSVKYVCTKSAGKLRWVKANNPTKSVTATPSKSVVPLESVVLRTLTNGMRNTSFQISLQEFPEIAQGITVDVPLSFNVLQASVYGVNTVQPEFFRVPFNQKSQYERALTNFEPFDASVSVTIWRASVGPSSLTESIDLAQGFIKVHSENVVSKVSPNTPSTLQAPMNLEMKLSQFVDLAPGAYVVVLGFEWKNLGILTVRLWGQESGANTVGGKGGGAVKACTYVPTPDAYSGGRAWAGLGITRWDGDPASSIGFGTKFVAATAKVTSCIVAGEWGNDIFNPGDLDLALVMRS